MSRPFFANSQEAFQQNLTFAIPGVAKQHLSRCLWFFRVLGFRVWGLGFRAWVLGFGARV